MRLSMVAGVLAVSASLLVVSGVAASGTQESPPLDPKRLLLLFEVGRWSVIDVDRGRRVRLIRASYWDFRRSPDGSRVAFPCGPLCIVRIDRATPTVAVRPFGQAGHGEAGSPTWSPDGRSLAFLWSSAPGVGALWEAHADGTGRRRLAAGFVSHPTWSPDGARIAYVAYAPPKQPQTWPPVPGAHGAPVEIVVMRQSATDRRTLARLHGGPGTPVWSHEGTRIAYIDDPPGTNLDGIYVVGVDGSRPRLVARVPAAVLRGRTPDAFAWSDDDTAIVYDGRPSYRVELRSGAITVITNPNPIIHAPRGLYRLRVAASPVGSGLYRGRLIAVGPNASGRRPLADQIASFAWSPDGRRIAYTRRDGLWVAALASGRSSRVLRWSLRHDVYRGPMIWDSAGSR